MTSEIEQTRQELIDGVSPAAARFAILKRGTLLTKAFMDLSLEGKVVLTLIYNLIQIAPGDILVNDGIVRIESRYLKAFRLTDTQITSALYEIVAAGFMKHLQSDIYIIAKTWDQTTKTSF